MDNARKVTKYLWWSIYLLLNGLTVFLVISLWNRFQLNPTVTSVETPTYPVDAVPFPGISLCNMNKINKNEAREVAQFIVDKTGENFTKIMNNLKFLGYLSDFHFPPLEQKDILEFQSILDLLNIKIIPLIKTLTTPCEEFLQDCWWRNEKINCSVLFSLRLTFEGFCCVFNYAKDTGELENAFPHVAVKGDSGLINGLSVIVSNNPENYYYTPMDAMGVNVHVFVPTDYPDKSSGNLLEVVADIGTENFIDITPTTVNAVRDVIIYPIDKRQCLFDVERQTKFGIYSQSDCFVDCRVRSVMALCECIPFSIPLSTDDSVCTLNDLSCLNRFKTKWMSLTPFEDVGERLNMEKQYSLFCQQTCFPSCDGTLYDVDTDSVPLHSLQKQNHTSLHIFYGKRFHNLFKQDVVYYWFEILSNFGGVFGLIIGLSLVSVTEIIHFTIYILIRKTCCCSPVKITN